MADCRNCGRRLVVVDGDPLHEDGTLLCLPTERDSNPSVAGDTNGRSSGT